LFGAACSLQEDSGEFSYFGNFSHVMFLDYIALYASVFSYLISVLSSLVFPRWNTSEASDFGASACIEFQRLGIIAILACLLLVFYWFCGIRFTE
jgi:hypothetical protein